MRLPQQVTSQMVGSTPAITIIVQLAPVSPDAGVGVFAPIVGR